MKRIIHRDRWPDDPDRECSHGQHTKLYTASGDSDKDNIPPKIADNILRQGNRNQPIQFKERSTHDAFQKCQETSDNIQAQSDMLAADKWDDSPGTSAEMGQKYTSGIYNTVHRDFKDMENTQENNVLVRYKNPPRTKEILTIPQSNMQENSFPDQHLHSHAPVTTAHTLRNPHATAELSPASLTISSPESLITEFCFNSRITDSYYAKGYLPRATITGYKDGILKTAEGRAYLCFHFEPSDL